MPELRKRCEVGELGMADQLALGVDAVPTVLRQLPWSRQADQAELAFLGQGGEEAMQIDCSSMACTLMRQIRGGYKDSQNRMETLLSGS